MRVSLRRACLGSLAATTSLLLTLGLGATPALADDLQHGPDPTPQSIAATTGPFATTTTTLAGNGRFGKATVTYPNAPGEGTFGVVAISPGFTAPWSRIAWLGPRLASQGFVVVGIDTRSPYDQPPARGDQLAAALEAAKTMPALNGIADFSREAVAGHSMGGGGALDAALKGDYDAVIGIAPFETAGKSFAGITEPTMILTGQRDTTAPPARLGKPFYTSVNGPKSYVEIAGGSHSFTNSPNVPQAASMIAFLKYAVDEDTRYVPFLSPGPPVGSGLSGYQSSGIAAGALLG